MILLIREVEYEPHDVAQYATLEEALAAVAENAEANKHSTRMFEVTEEIDWWKLLKESGNAKT